MIYCSKCICSDCIRYAAHDCRRDLCGVRCFHGGHFVPNGATECPDHVHTEWAIKQRCIMSEVLEFNDGSLFCPLLEEPGCEWCCAMLEKRLEEL